MKFQNLGWIIAAGMGATLLTSGFQSQGNKIGIVNMQSVFQTSEAYQAKEGQLEAMRVARSDIMNFIQTYPTITTAQANRFRILSLKTDITPQEKTELDKIKADVIAGDQAFKALQQKKNPTAAEVAQLQTFNAQGQQTVDLWRSWGDQFNTEMNDQKDKFRDEVLTKVTGAVQDTSKKQGFTIVFTNDIAPFSSNDVTADTLKVMNAKK